MKFDIIMPVYNTEDRLLVASINSVLNQTHKDWTLYVCLDGGHCKKFPKVPFDERIIYLQSNKHGHSSTRNFAMDKCTSLYWAFLDSDDLFYPTKLEVANKLILEHQPDILVHKLDFLGADWKPKPQICCDGSEMWQTRDIIDLNDLRYVGVLPTQSIIKATSHRFDENFDLRAEHYEDNDFFFELPLKNYYYTPEVLGGKVQPYQKLYNFTYLVEKHPELRQPEVPQHLAEQWIRDKNNYLT